MIGELTKTVVNIKVLKVELQTYWYKELIGKITKAEKVVYKNGKIAYRSIENAQAYFTINDIEEIK